MVTHVIWQTWAVLNASPNANVPARKIPWRSRHPVPPARCSLPETRRDKRLGILHQLERQNWQRTEELCGQETATTHALGIQLLERAVLHLNLHLLHGRHCRVG